MGVEMECFGLKMGSGFAAPGGTHPAKLRGLPPPPQANQMGINVLSEGAPACQRAGLQSSLVRMCGKACHHLVKRVMMV